MYEHPVSCAPVKIPIPHVHLALDAQNSQFLDYSQKAKAVGAFESYRLMLCAPALWNGSSDRTFLRPHNSLKKQQLQPCGGYLDGSL